MKENNSLVDELFDRAVCAHALSVKIKRENNSVSTGFSDFLLGECVGYLHCLDLLGVDVSDLLESAYDS